MVRTIACYFPQSTYLGTATFALHFQLSEHHQSKQEPLFTTNIVRVVEQFQVLLLLVLFSTLQRMSEGTLGELLSEEWPHIISENTD